MTIQHKLRLLMWLAVALGASLATVFLVTQRWEAAVYAREQVLDQIVEQALRLSLLDHELYLYPDLERPVTQWRQTHHTLGELLERTGWGARDEPFVQRLEDARWRLELLFGRLQRAPPAPIDAELAREQQERLHEQLHFTVQVLVAEALYFQRTFHQRAGRQRRIASGLAMVLAILLTLGIAALARATGNSIVRPLQRLRTGTAIVGAGDLTHRVGTTSPDELGQLSRDFDAMLARLQKATTSREALAREVARRMQSEEALRKSEGRLKIAQAIGRLGHWELNIRRGTMSWSDETCRILGYTPQSGEPSRERFLQVVHPGDRTTVEAFLQRAAQGEEFDVEYRILLAEGHERTVHARGEMLHRDPGAGPELLGIIQDITERKALERQLEQEAHTDPLTGCANRRHFLELAAHEIARSRRYGHALALLMLDLDHFKGVNDRYGHQLGDEVLKALVGICQAGLREEDLLGRIGGEEFAVLLPETDRERALEVAERLREAVAVEKIRANGQLLGITTSIGVATLEDEDTGVDAFLGRADQALYAAKRNGRNRVESR